MSDLAEGLVRCDDGVVRCWWCVADEGYRHYHDHEWGQPLTDDRRLFEKLCLEGFQCGLSWITILRKREAFRSAFHGFDIDAVAVMTDADVQRLLADPGIVRHQGKIRSAIQNAARAQELRREFGTLAAWFWQWEPKADERPASITYESVRKLATIPSSVALSRDLKKRGWTFVGPTTMYAFMQAMGLVNDHLEGCPARDRALAARARFVRPGADALVFAPTQDSHSV